MTAAAQGERTQRVPGARTPWRRMLSPSMILAALIGLTFGSSGLFGGFYDVAVWGPVTLGMLIVLSALIVAGVTPIGRARLGWVAVAALAFVWLWSLASAAWAESEAATLESAHRWLLYATLLALLLMIVRDRRVAVVLVGSSVAAILLVAGYVLAMMITGSAGPLFVEGRPGEPLGYINGQAAYMLLAFWPLVAVAERARHRVVSGAAIGGAILVGSLVVLGQARATLLALAVSAAVLLVAVPGTWRRTLVLVAIGAGIAIISQPLLDVFATQSAPTVVQDAAQRAGVAAVLSAIVLGLAWTAVGTRLQRLGPARPSWRLDLRWVPGLAIALALCAAALVSITNPVDRISSEWRAFTTLNASTPTVRFFSLGGARYDYWRVSVNQFADSPLLGVGAGNFSSTYFAERRLGDDVRQPHSLVFQALGELGLPGLLALAAFVVGVLVALWRRRKLPDGAPIEHGLSVAGAGMFLVWFTHTSVDWLHLLPGLTGIALCGAAVVLAPTGRRDRPADSSSLPRRLGLALAVGAILLGAVGVSRLLFAEHYRTRASALVPTDPAGAASNARRSLTFVGASVQTRYVLAAAHARRNDYAAARATLLEAATLEPSNAVTWGLLGDLAARRGERRQAATAYERAHRLNPRDAFLRDLDAAYGPDSP